MQATLMKEVFDFHDRLSKVRFFEDICSIPYGEFTVLKYLMENRNQEEARIISKMAPHFKVSSPAISRTVKNMLDKHWINREENMLDRRIVYLSLTDKGREVFAQEIGRIHDYFFEVFSRLDNQDISEWVRIGNILVDVMYDVLDEAKNSN